MKIVQRGTRLSLAVALCLCLFALSTLAQEQEDGDLTITGSRLIVENILSPALDASGVELAADLTSSGTNTGLEAFCSGDAAIAGATRVLTLTEGEFCDSNRVEFVEYLVGYDAIALIANPELSFVECLTANDLNTLFAPSASADVTNWTASGLADATDTPLSVFLPATDSATYFLLDNAVDGFGLRPDATIATEDIVAQVASTPGAIGVTDLNTAMNAEGVNLVELNTSELDTCVLPSPETIDSREYATANQLMLYVNTDAFETENLQAFLAYLLSGTADDIITQAGFTPPSSEAATLNQQILAGEAELGRQFSRDVIAFEIPSDVIGAFTIGGTTNAVTYLNNVTSAFARNYPSVTINVNTFGEIRDATVFCNGTGEVDILSTGTPLEDITITLPDVTDLPDPETTPEAESTAEPALDDAPPMASIPLIENCDNNNVEPITFDLGTRAAVLFGNANAEFLAPAGEAVCLTQDEVRTIFGAPSTDTVTTWDAVRDGLDAVDLFTFAPPLGTSRYADLLLAQPGSPVIPMRSDITEVNRDTQYRAAAVANAPGTISFMGWNEYQELPEEQQANLRLFQINNGETCITPSLETITNGDYPYTEVTSIVVDNNRLNDQGLVSVLWFMFSDENFQLLEDAGFIGLTANDLPAIREQLQDTYDAFAAAEFDSDIFNPLATPIAP